MNNKDIISLRPHHCMCIQFFEGKGYNKEFVNNLSELVRILEETDPVVQLTEGCDDICRCCPENIGGVCRTAEKVSGIDRRCTETAGLEQDGQYRWSVLRDTVREKIISSGNPAQVCLDCCWLEICI